MMTKKHFKEIAEILKNHLSEDILYSNNPNETERAERIKLNSERLINDFCNFCKADNSNFSRERFKDAVLSEVKQ